MSTTHMSPEAVAERWQLHVRTLTRWRHEGIGPVYLKLRGKVLYRQDDIEAYEAESLYSSPSQRINAGGRK